MVAKITRSQTKNSLSWIKGSKEWRWNEPCPSDWGRTHWRPCKRRKKEGPPHRSWNMQGSGSLWYKSQLGVIHFKAQVQREEFSFNPGVVRSLLDISGRWGARGDAPTRKSKKISKMSRCKTSTNILFNALFTNCVKGKVTQWEGTAIDFWSEI